MRPRVHAALFAVTSTVVVLTACLPSTKTGGSGPQFDLVFDTGDSFIDTGFEADTDTDTDADADADADADTDSDTDVDCSAGDGLEPNDGPAQAPFVQSASNLTLTAASPDFYYTEVPADATLDVFVQFQHSDGNLDVALYTASGTVLTTASSTTDNESASWTNFSGSTVVVFTRLQLAPGSGGVCVPYDYSASISSGFDTAPTGLGTGVLGWEGYSGGGNYDLTTATYSGVETYGVYEFNDQVSPQIGDETTLCEFSWQASNPTPAPAGCPDCEWTANVTMGTGTESGPVGGCAAFGIDASINDGLTFGYGYNPVYQYQGATIPVVMYYSTGNTTWTAATDVNVSFDAATGAFDYVFLGSYGYL